MKIGVHNKMDIEQEDFCFELDSIGENVMLLMNSKEQMFAEKLRSLLKLGRFSTRYKDLFDFYYFIAIAGVNRGKLNKCIAEYILSAEDMRENSISDIYNRLSSIFKGKAYLEKASAAHNNWLDIPITEVTEGIKAFFKDDISSR